MEGHGLQRPSVAGGRPFGSSDLATIRRAPQGTLALKALVGPAAWRRGAVTSRRLAPPTAKGLSHAAFFPSPLL